MTQIQLTTEDVGFVDAVDALDTMKGTMLATRTFVLLVHRPEWKLKLYEQVNNALVFIVDVPGGKNGPSKMLAGIDCIRIWAPTRGDNPDEPNPLWYIELPMPGIFPTDYGAVRRLWGETRAAVTALDGLANALRPYTK